jgi:hypothetical protein
MPEVERCETGGLLWMCGLLKSSDKHAPTICSQDLIGYAKGRHIEGECCERAFWQFALQHCGTLLTCMKTV